MESKPLGPFELFDTPWFKDATSQLCADGWPTFVVPLNVEIRKAKEAYQNALDKIAELEKQVVAREVCPACGEEFSLDQKIRMAHNVMDYEAKIDKLTAENINLREALNKIEAIYNDFNVPIIDVSEIRKIIRESK